MEKLYLSDIAKAIGTESFLNLRVSSVCTDTRAIEKDSLFIALKGNNFDGNDYVEAALAGGALAAVSEREFQRPDVLKVENTGKALLDLAAWYRRRFNPFTVGITGSVGKTTTKEMIYSVLAQSGKTLKTQGNFNNEIGLPKTLLGLDASYENAVIEMGMSNFGEISRLSKTAKPDIGVITNIGVSHIENLGSREGILKAKLEILDGMQNNSPLIINTDNDMLLKAAGTIPNAITFAVKNKADFKADNIICSDVTTEFDIIKNNARVHIVVPAVGEHNIYNALAAYCVGTVKGMPPEEIAKGILNYTPSGMRQKIYRKDGYKIIADCYNASPDSMKAALNVLKTVAGGRKTAVLGDMLELGDRAKEFHKQVGEYASECADAVFCFGEMSEYIAQAADSKRCRSYHFDDKNELTEALKKSMEPGDTILFKASRAMKFEEIIEKLF